MKLVAALITKNERSRYLDLCLDSLLEFCDEVRVLDDYSSDGTYELLLHRERVAVLTNPAVTFDKHEGQARQALLDWVREAEPTHVLAIDADEFVADGLRLRSALEAEPSVPVWSLDMEEVWNADDFSLYTRQDGGWRAHGVTCCWRVGDNVNGGFWKIRDRALACGREPVAVSEIRSSAHPTHNSILHFGWTNVTERQRRYDRYMAIDGGAFHASTHLQSIMWPERKIKLRQRPWPEGMDREAVLEKVREVRG